MGQVYLDNAATTPLRKEVADAMVDVLKNDFGNPSSTHSYGRSSKVLIENSRKKIAEHFNVEASEIIFTSGGTEADNMVIKSSVRDLGVTRIITSRIEHHAVLHSIDELKKNNKIEEDFVELNSNGEVDLGHLEKLLENSNKRTLVSLMHVNNEIGNKLDLKRVAVLCQEKNALFHSDTVQSVGHFNLDFKDIPIDFAVASAHKFHGPKGVGFAFIRKSSGIRPLIHGGEQERGLRAGTEAVHQIVGLTKALELAYTNLEDETNYIKSIKKYCIEQLESYFKDVKFNGMSNDLEHSTYTILNVCLPISPNRSSMLLFQLDLKDIACSKGSACQSGSTATSHVLQEILTDDDLQKPSVRFSFSKYNTTKDIDYTIQVLKEFIDE
jgi:cysteine desulfurase